MGENLFLDEKARDSGSAGNIVGTSQNLYAPLLMLAKAL